MTTPALLPYVPRLLPQWQSEEPHALWREFDASVVFVDVSGFTRMSERLARHGRVGAEEVTEVIGNTFGTLLWEAYSFGGSLLKFGGDALLLFFSDDGHPARAAAAAHGMRAKLREMGTFSTTAGKVTLRMSVGAHTGRFHFFLVGDSHRELIVAGPAASELVAMEAAASAGQILLSPALAEALPKRNRGRPLGPGVLLSRDVEAERSDVVIASSDVDLTPFIPKALRGTLLEGGMEPEHRPVTVAFIHFSGFDELVNHSGPEVAATALDELVRTVQHAVDARGVAFLATDVAGDGGKIIVTAGAPTVTGADEELMLLVLREVASAELTLPIEIGVNQGDVFAGEIGPYYRRIYTVMGDAVNLAARLMAKAEPGQILTTEDVLAGSRTLFETAEIEPFTPKGKKKPVQAFAVGKPRGSRAAITEAGLPLVGRDEELAVLLESWEAARSGSGRMVELRAEAGMGKSRLMEEFLSRVEGAAVLSAECRLYQSTTPYFPFRSLMRQAFGLEGWDERETVVGLSRLVEEKAPELVPVLSLIAVPFDVLIPESKEVAMLKDEFRRTRLEEAVESLLAATLTEPAVITIEDTHWMDEASRELLARLAHSVEGRPWLIVLSRRPGEDGFAAAEELGSLSRMDLQPLGAKQAADLIHAATSDTPLMPHQVQSLAERAHGNPLFLIELLDALRRGEDMEAMPPSVEGLIQARIDRLAPADRTLLRNVSVLGASFEAKHAAAVLSGTRITDPRRALRRLTDFVAIQTADRVEFRHALIRDVAYQGLPYRTRQTLHAQVADSILQAAGKHPEDQADLLSLHYFEAKRWEEAWAYSRIAANRAKGIYANLEAARSYERSLKALRGHPVADRDQEAETWIALGDVRMAAGLFDEAIAAFRQAGRLLDHNPIARSGLHLKRARALVRLGSFSAALRQITTGYRLVGSDDSPAGARARARLLAFRAGVRVQRGHPRPAVADALEALELGERYEDRETVARSYYLLDGAYEMLGEVDKAVYSTQALEIYEALGSLPDVATVQNNIGVRLYSEGRWGDALEAFRQAQQAHAKAGDQAHAAATGANIGQVLIDQGQIGEATEILVDAVRILRAHNLVEHSINAEIQLARARLRAGDIERGQGDLERLFEQASSMAMDDMVLEAAMSLAEIHIRRGDGSGALALLSEVEKRAADVIAFYEAGLANVKARALAACEMVSEALDQVDRGLPIAREQGLAYEEALLLRTKAGLKELAGEDNAAELAASDEILSRLGVLRAGSE